MSEQIRFHQGHSIDYIVLKVIDPVHATFEENKYTPGDFIIFI